MKSSFSLELCKMNFSSLRCCILCLINKTEGRGCSCSVELYQRWEVTKYKYYWTWVDVLGICTWLEYLFFWQLLIFPLYTWTQISNLLLITFSKQACYFSLNAFVFLAELRMLYQPKMTLFDILGMRLNNLLIFWCV